jgi:hypothetical protein
MGLGMAAVLLWVTVAPAAPTVIVGNNAGPEGPIVTWDLGDGSVVDFFVPDGATFMTDEAFANGRGVVVVANEVFYTELLTQFVFEEDVIVDILAGVTDFIRVAPYNGGTGGADTRMLPNPRPGTGIQNLAFSGGILYALTGYLFENDVTPASPPLKVYKLDPVTGAVLPGSPVTIGPEASPSADGFGIHPNGNFLINEEGGSPTYKQFDPVTGAYKGAAFDITVPNATNSTGVDTDGVSLLFFATEFTEITRTSLAGVDMGTTVLDDSPLPNVEDVSLVRGGAHFWVGLKNSDDQGTNFDLLAEVRKNGGVVLSGLVRCIRSLSRPASNAKEVIVDFGSLDSVPVASADMLELKVYTRIGTNPDDTMCASSHSSARGLRLYYDAMSRASGLSADFMPSQGTTLYLRSNGTNCTANQSTGTSNRFLDDTAPTATSPKCKDSSNINFAKGNPFKEISNWSLTVP